MTNREFFFSILPETGWYCAAILSPTGKFIPSFFKTRDEAYDYVTARDAEEQTVYFAQASFKQAGQRTQDSVHALKSFWLDIDCGTDKPFATQEEGLAALDAFVEKNNLFEPSVVNSGNGLYAYWILEQEISPEQWKPVAESLKSLCIESGFKIDSGPTADSSRVLRPTGTHNRKYGEKEVTMLREAEEVSFEEFRGSLPDIVADIAPPPGVGYDEFTAGIEKTYREVTSDEVAENCAFMAHVKEKRGDVSEPVWYYALGVLNCCSDRDTAIHTWSNGYPGYSAQETNRFADQWRDKNLGATTCRQLTSIAPELCLGCPYKLAVTSPISIRLKQTLIEKDRCKPPYGFAVTADGISFEKKKIYSREIQPVSVGHDYTLGYEVAVFSVNDKFESWRPFRLRTALFNDPRSCLMAAADQGVTLQGGDSKKLMVQFLEGYINSLKQMEKRSKYCAQMGWQADPNGELIFVLGDTIYKRDGEEQIGLAGSISEIARHFTCEGSLEEWVKITEKFNTPNIEPLAFEFLTLAFGAPLMYFTGYSGAMVSAKGAESGVGKTMSGQWGISTYGPPKKLELHQNDTQNALVSRLGVCNTLPIYIDEITEMAPEALSNLVYRITDGRDKLSLTSKREERSGQSWCTIAVVTANNGVVDKLGGFKPDASAQINRVFEYTVKRNPALTVNFWKQVVPVFTNNYGHAGIEFARYLAEHQDDHKRQIQAYINVIHSQVGANPEERFWVAILAATFYGAKIAQDIGLIRFDISNTVKWALSQIGRMRIHRTENTTDAPSILAAFLGDNLASILAVDSGTKVATILRDPTRGIIGRYEKNTHRLWMSQASMKTCFKSYGYSRAKTELTDSGMLVETGNRKILGMGTKYGLGMSQTVCWLINVDDEWLVLREEGEEE